jgi:hypothetical protein
MTCLKTGQDRKRIIILGLYNPFNPFLVTVEQLGRENLRFKRMIGKNASPIQCPALLPNLLDD